MARESASLLAEARERGRRGRGERKGKLRPISSFTYSSNVLSLGQNFATSKEYSQHLVLSLCTVYIIREQSMLDIRSC